MRVVIDAFGGDNAPLEIVKGAALSSNEFNCEITLTGNEAEINSVIKENNLRFNGELKIIHTEDVITMHDDPTSLLKAHKDCSMALAFKELAEGRADAFVSAGSTGAIVVGGTLIVKRIRGIKRPALGGMIPSPKGHYMLMDMGANAECRPEMLEQFGIMASDYLMGVDKNENPHSLYSTSAPRIRRVPSFKRKPTSFWKKHRLILWVILNHVRCQRVFAML